MLFNLVEIIFFILKIRWWKLIVAGRDEFFWSADFTGYNHGGIESFGLMVDGDKQGHHK